ncbi:retrovirus-related pol polyprotein from transposon TNT 1-94 [Tanacetum coccineum]
MMKEMSYELLNDDQKKQLGKNNESKMTLYNALPHKEYERTFMRKTAKELSIASEENIHSGFTRFNVVVTSLKYLDQDYSSKNHVRKFLRALSLKWRAKVTTIKEAKDLATLLLDELIGKLKVYEMILENDGVASKTTTEKVKSLALKAKVTREQTSDDSDSQGGSNEDVDEEVIEAFNLMATNFHKFFRKHNSSGCGNRFGNGANGFGRCGGNSFRNKGGERSRQRYGSHENTMLYFRDRRMVNLWVCLKCDLLSNDRNVDSGCTKHMTGNRRLVTSYQVYDGRHVVFGSNLEGKVIGVVISDINVLGMGVLDWIARDGYGCLTWAQHADKDTYSASAEGIEVQSYFLDDQLTSLSPPRNYMPSDMLLRESRQPA